MKDLAQYLAGQFIVFDGPDGSGKSTQLSRFVHRCRGEGVVVMIVKVIIIIVEGNGHRSCPRQAEILKK